MLADPVFSQQEKGQDPTWNKPHTERFMACFGKKNNLKRQRKREGSWNIYSSALVKTGFHLLSCHRTIKKITTTLQKYLQQHQFIITVTPSFLALLQCLCHSQGLMNLGKIHYRYFLCCIPSWNDSLLVSKNSVKNHSKKPTKKVIFSKHNSPRESLWWVSSAWEQNCKREGQTF